MDAIEVCFKNSDELLDYVRSITDDYRVAIKIKNSFNSIGFTRAKAKYGVFYLICDNGSVYIKYTNAKNNRVYKRKVNKVIHRKARLSEHIKSLISEGFYSLGKLSLTGMLCHV